MKAVFLSFLLLCAPAGAFAADQLADLFSVEFSTFSAPAPLLRAGAAQLPGVEAPGVSAAGFISLWSQDCSAEQCSLPQALMPARKVAFEMVLPNGPAAAFCAASLNAGDFLPFPVFMCAANPAPGKRLGVTLHRI